MLIDIAGELDLHTVAAATALPARVTAISPRHLVLDLSAVTFVDSSGLCLLIAAQSGQDGIRGRLPLLGVTEHRPVQRPLALVGLLDALISRPIWTRCSPRWTQGPHHTPG